MVREVPALFKASKWKRNPWGHSSGIWFLSVQEHPLPPAFYKVVPEAQHFNRTQLPRLMGVCSDSKRTGDQRVTCTSLILFPCFYRYYLKENHWKLEAVIFSHSVCHHLLHFKSGKHAPKIHTSSCFAKENPHTDPHAYFLSPWAVFPSMLEPRLCPVSDIWSQIVMTAFPRTVSRTYVHRLPSNPGGTEDDSSLSRVCSPLASSLSLGRFLWMLITFSILLTPYPVLSATLLTLDSFYFYSYH